MFRTHMYRHIYAVFLIFFITISAKRDAEFPRNPLTESSRKAIVQFARACVTEVKASKDDFDALRTDPPYPKDTSCILMCMFSKVGIVKRGQYSKQGLMTALAPMVFRNKKKLQRIQNMTEACEQEIPRALPKACDLGNNVIICLYKYAPELRYNIDFDEVQQAS